MKNEFEAKQKNPKYRSMCAIRKKLPSYKKRDEILELIRNNQVILISGETGVYFNKKKWTVNYVCDML